LHYRWAWIGLLSLGSGLELLFLDIPRYPSQGNLNFNIIKNEVTGMDISSLVCESGVITIDLKDDEGTR
jgi:hypothetical protein